MERHEELIARVAQAYINEQLGAYPIGILRFCLMGLGSRLTTSVASAIHDGLSQVEVHIPESLVCRELISDKSIISREASARWRNSPPNDPGKRAILFAVDNLEIQKIGHTIANLAKIDSASLRELTPHWLSASGLASLLKDEEEKIFVDILSIVNKANLARTLDMFANFVLQISDKIQAGTCTSVQSAADLATSALHLPSETGLFTSYNRLSYSIYAKMRKRAAELRFFLAKRNERGDFLDEQECRTRIDELVKIEELTTSQLHILEEFFQDHLVSPDDWRPSQAELANESWQTVGKVFEGLPRTRKKKEGNLGQQTVAYFREELPGILTEEEELLLEDVKTTRKPDDTVAEFFYRHRQLIAQSKSTISHKTVASRWEKLIFRKPRETSDFLVGLLDSVEKAMEKLDPDFPSSMKFVLKLEGSDTLSFWQERHNGELSKYFRQRFHGFYHVFGDTIEFQLGRMMEKPLEPIDINLQPSTSKLATQFKFELLIKDRESGVELRDSATQFIWSLAPATIPIALPANLNALVQSDSILCLSWLESQPISDKGTFQKVTLTDRSTLQDVRESNTGLLVGSAPEGRVSDIALDLYSELKQLELDGVLDHDQIMEFRHAFDEFKETYRMALKEWTAPEGLGVSSPYFLEQAAAYGRLLELLRQRLFTERCRNGIWRSVLSIGLGFVNEAEGGEYVIVPPWAPLRMAEIYAKNEQVATSVKQLCETPGQLSVPSLFFEQLRDEIERPFYMELCSNLAMPSKLLSLTEHLVDYSLLSCASTQSSSSAKDRKEAVKSVLSVFNEYLSLLPHESANFSVLVCNPSNAQLPAELAAELAQRVDSDRRMRCVMTLAYTEASRTRDSYQRYNEAATDDSAFVLSSDIADEFLSRFRMDVRELEEIEITEGGPPVDITVLEDAIADSSSIEWHRLGPQSSYPLIASHSPNKWSRRKPVGRGDQSVYVYLSAPSLPRECQAYANLLASLVGQRETGSADWLPVRKVSATSREVGCLVEKVHQLSDWVICHDSIADRRLLRNLKIEILRYVSKRSSPQNLMVSTRQTSPLLRRVLQKRISELIPNANSDKASNAAQLFINRALELSGLIVMRAANYSHYAAELLGIVLSMERIRRFLGSPSDRYIGWYSLDDYASWLGQKEGEIADILVLHPAVVDDTPVLNIVVSEAKFIGYANLGGCSQKSKLQLLESILKLTALLDTNHVDRSMWLHRMADLMLEGMDPFSDIPLNGWDLETWAEKVRHGEIRTEVVGFSHVFVHDHDLNRGPAEVVREKPYCTQEALGRADVRDEILAFLGESPILHLGHDNETDVASHNDKTELPELVNPLPPKRDDAMVDNLIETVDLASKPKSQWFERLFGNVALETRDTEPNDALEWLEKTEQNLKSALRNYGMTAEVIDRRLTPNAGLFRLRGTDDLTVAKVEKKQQELLTSHALDIINVSPGLGEIRIMVRRPKREILNLMDIWALRTLPREASELNLSLVLGSTEVDGELLYLNVGHSFAGRPQHGPHTLIAGETGSGKGVLTQVLLLDLCATNSPATTRLKFIDPKAGVDYPWLQELPHLDGQIITSQEDATACLAELVTEMDRRYELFQKRRVSKLAKYNEVVDGPEQLPFIWLFHDELADWMLQDDYRKAVEEHVSRLGVKARAAGIHLVFITQRPDKSCFPMQLRSNLGNRLVLKVSDRRNSELVLDQSGAERLLGKGHLAAKLSGEPDVVLAQVPFLDDETIWQIVEKIRSHWAVSV